MNSLADEAAHSHVVGMRDIQALESVPLSQRIGGLTVRDLLARGTRLQPERPALRFLPHGRHDEPVLDLSHHDLSVRVARLAESLRGLGVGRRDSVAILAPNLPETVIALLAAMRSGIAFPINWMLEPAQIAALLKGVDPKVLVALGPVDGYDIWRKVQALPGSLLRKLALIRIGASIGALDDMGGEPVGARSSQASGLDDADPEDDALFIHTGGTTGAPKVARVPHRAIVYKCWAYRCLLAQASHHVLMGVSPLFHVGGIVLRTVHPLACGMSIVIPGPIGLRDRKVVSHYWHLVERFGVTELSAVPTALTALAEVPADGIDLSSLRPWAVTGSAAVSQAVARHFDSVRGVRLLSDYGLTEATATVSLPPRDADPRPGSSGLRLPYTKIRIAAIDANGKIQAEQPCGEVGEVLVSSPGVIHGYVDARMDAQLFIEPGWIRTGDLGRLDEDGWLWVTGRSKDLIIRGGHNLDPRVPEEVLQLHPGVQLAAVVGRPDAYAGELPVAYVQLRPGQQVSAEALLAHLRTHVPERAATPVALDILAELPLTAVGKVYKPALRERAASDAVRALIMPVLPEDVVAAVRSIHDADGTLRVLVSLQGVSPEMREPLIRALQHELARITVPCLIECVHDPAPD